MYTCETVPLSEWESLRPIFNDELNSDLPHYKYGAIIGIKDNGELVGFASLESLLLVSQTYLRDDYRNSGARAELFQHVENLVRQQQGRSIGIVAKGMAATLKHYGMTERGTLWRLDL